MLDQVLDTNQTGMYQLHATFGLPEFVKEAAQADADTVRDLPATAFAWPERRMFPVHTKADTWQSAAYFQKFGSDIENVHRTSIEANLKSACELWKIDMPAPVIQKTSAKGQTGYVIRYPLSGQSACTVGVETAEDMLKVACDVTTAGKYPYGVRKSVAVSILASPDDLRSSIVPEMDVELHKIAGYGVGTIDNALGAIRQRQLAIGQQWPPMTASLTEVATLVEKSASKEGILSHELLDKLGHMLDAVDRFAGLYNRYNEGFRPAEQQLFSITTRDFDDFAKQAVRLSTGEVVSRQDLKTADVRLFLEECFGEKCASEDEVIQAVTALPERRARLLSEHIRQAVA
jgi:hypothetical protein